MKQMEIRILKFNMLIIWWTHRLFLTSKNRLFAHHPFGLVNNYNFGSIQGLIGNIR
uniref:Uncharacterized protein n=1 Tax=Tetranychus urticae TaxID=32264 RepID=T1KHX0_TETUR